MSAARLGFEGSCLPIWFIRKTRTRFHRSGHDLPLTNYLEGLCGTVNPTLTVDPSGRSVSQEASSMKGRRQRSLRYFIKRKGGAEDNDETSTPPGIPSNTATSKKRWEVSEGGYSAGSGEECSPAGPGSPTGPARPSAGAGSGTGSGVGAGASTSSLRMAL